MSAFGVDCRSSALPRVTATQVLWSRLKASGAKAPSKQMASPTNFHATLFMLNEYTTGLDHDP